MKTIKLNQIAAIALIAIASLFTTQGTLAQKGKMMMPTDGSKVIQSKYPTYAKTVAKIKQAINENGLMVLNEIDAQAMMKMAGKDIGPTGQIFFFHPKYLRKLSEANMMALIAIPLKIVLMERMGSTKVRYFLPSQTLKPYKGTEALAKELDGIVEKIIGTVKGKM